MIGKLINELLEENKIKWSELSETDKNALAFYRQELDEEAIKKQMRKKLVESLKN
jgi:hypothetical protein